jgi:hypothetical protein
MKTIKFGAAIAGLLLTGVLILSTAMAAEDAASEFSWDGFDPSYLPEVAEVQDISGKYTCVMEGFIIDADGNLAMVSPYQQSVGTLTFEQHGSLLLVTVDDGQGDIYYAVGSTTDESILILWTGFDEFGGDSLYYEEVLDGDILDSGEIVFNTVGSAYDVDKNAIINWADAGVLTPVPAAA